MSERFPEQINIDDEIRRYATADPFIPFDILTTSGDRYAIKRHLQVAVGATAIVILLPVGTQIVRKNQIVAVHLHQPAD